jgi:hypothetical protein
MSAGMRDEYAVILYTYILHMAFSYSCMRPSAEA